MSIVFLKLLNMSITAGWLILAVVLLRMLFAKTSKGIRLLLWAIVGIRLICPFSIKSPLSLIPSAETVPKDIIYSQKPTLEMGIHIVNQRINPVILSNFTPGQENSTTPIQRATSIASMVWIIGAVILLLYAMISYIRLYRRVQESVLLYDNLWLCDNVRSPFILGIIRPRIYLPSDLSEWQQKHVIAHEKAHLKRLDYLWKPLAYVLLTIYWFHPLIWLAYILLCRDIELACDEHVVKHMDIEEKKTYSKVLLSCSIPRRMIAACPLAFGEVGVKQRIKSVLNYKKPAFWIMAVAIISCAIVAVCFLTNPADKSSKEQTSEIVSKNEDADMQNNEIDDRTEPDQSGGYAETVELNIGDEKPITITEEKLIGIFKNSENYNGCIVTDCVIAPDGAYDLMGVIQYTDSNKNPCNLAFIRDGICQPVGLDTDNNLIIADNSSLTYLGNGYVYLILKNKLDGNLYDYTVGFSEAGVNTNLIVKSKKYDPLDKAISAAILEHNKSTGFEKYFYHCEDHMVLKKETGKATKDGKTVHTVTVYAVVLYQKYDIYNDALREIGGSHIPTALTFHIDEKGNYLLNEYWIPGGGSYYVTDVVEKFPSEIVEDALDSQKYIVSQIQNCYAQAVEYGRLDTDKIVENLLNSIMSSLEDTTKPITYEELPDIDYRELIYYREYSLRYVFSQFLKGNQTDLKGHIMRILMDDLIGEEALKITAENGQEYFDAWLEDAQKLKEKLGEEWLKENRPYAFMALHMKNE